MGALERGPRQGPHLAGVRRFWFLGSRRGAHCLSDSLVQRPLLQTEPGTCFSITPTWGSDPVLKAPCVLGGLGVQFLISSFQFGRTLPCWRMPQTPSCVWVQKGTQMCWSQTQGGSGCLKSRVFARLALVFRGSLVFNEISETTPGSSVHQCALCA